MHSWSRATCPCITAAHTAQPRNNSSNTMQTLPKMTVNPVRSSGVAAASASLLPTSMLALPHRAAAAAASGTPHIATSGRHSNPSLHNKTCNSVASRHFTSLPAARPPRSSPLTLPPRCSRQSSRCFYGSQIYNPPTPQSGRPYNPADWHATTILSVRRGNEVVVIGDGQVSLGNTVIKDNARKVRVIGNNKVITGFAGSTSDCFALLDRLEKKLEQYPGELLRAAVEMAKEWRTDKYLRHLEAFLIAVDKDVSVTVTGSGDVMSAPADGVIGIGSGSMFAISAARALVHHGAAELTPVDIAKHSMAIASSICVYTNGNQIIETIKDGELQSTIVLEMNTSSTAHVIEQRPVIEKVEDNTKPDKV